jgi:GDP-4-dehydro-6-deoxy-D-mannose reductase
MSGRAGIEVMVTRVFNLIGPRLPIRLVAGSLCAQFVDPTCTVIRVGNTSTQRDFVDVRDAVAAYWSVAERGRPGEVYNVCSGRPVSVESILGKLAEAAGRSPRIEVDTARLRANDPAVVFGDNAKIRQATGWTASIPLMESLRDMISETRKATAR